MFDAGLAVPERDRSNAYGLCLPVVLPSSSGNIEDCGAGACGFNGACHDLSEGYDCVCDSRLAVPESDISNVYFCVSYSSHPGAAGTLLIVVQVHVT